MSRSKSKAAGASSGGRARAQSGTQSSSAAKSAGTLDTSASTAGQKSRLIFQPTESWHLDAESTNAQIVVAFATKLGALVQWRKIELADGSVVLALCFPLSEWSTNAEGELVRKREPA